MTRTALLFTAAAAAILLGLAPRARADREVTIELVTGDDDPPSHLCVLAREIDKHTHGLLGRSDQLAFVRVRPNEPKLQVQKTTPMSNEAHCRERVPHGAWIDNSGADPCEASFTPTPEEIMQCVLNEAPGGVARVGVAVLRLDAVRLLGLRFSGNVATFNVRDLRDTADDGIRIEAVGGHYTHATATSRPVGPTSTREEARVALARRCLPRRIDAISTPEGTEHSIHLTVGELQTKADLPTPIELEVPRIPSDQRIRATFRGIRYVAVPTDATRREALQLMPTRVRFKWHRHCLVPAQTCPHATLPQAPGSPRAVLVHNPDPSVCEYEASSAPEDTPIALPTQVRFDLPRVRAHRGQGAQCEAQAALPDAGSSGANDTWFDELRYIGEGLSSYIPPEQRWIAVLWPDRIAARSEQHRDRIDEVELHGPSNTIIRMKPNTPRVNVPGLQCDDHFVYRYVGDRAFKSAVVRIRAHTGTIDLGEAECIVSDEAGACPASEGWRPECSGLGSYASGQRFVRALTPDDLETRSWTLALAGGAGGVARVPDDEMASTYAFEVDAIVAHKPAHSSNVLLELRFATLYTRHPFRSFLAIRDGGTLGRSNNELVPFFHFSLEGLVTFATSDTLYLGAGAGPAFGTRLLLDDAQKTSNAMEVAFRYLVAWRINNGLALEANARALFLGSWIEVTQSESGLLSRKEKSTSLFLFSLMLRYDDLI